MFAVLKTGGKQYKVANGDILRIEKVTGNAGEKVQFNEILMVGGDNLVVGAPNVAGAAVQAEILEQGKGPKVINYVNVAVNIVHNAVRVIASKLQFYV